MFPEGLEGHQISFLKYNSPEDGQQTYETIPSWFWNSKTYECMPTNPFYRKNLCYDIMDLDHAKICQNNEFHIHRNDNCICIHCGERANYYHKRNCSGKPKIPDLVNSTSPMITPKKHVTQIRLLKLKPITPLQVEKLMKKCSVKLTPLKDTKTKRLEQTSKISPFRTKDRIRRTRIPNPKFFNDNWINN